MDNEIKRKFIFVLQIKKHDFDTPTMTMLKEQLQGYGVLALRALDRYIKTPNTPFFDFSYLMGLIYDEKRKSLNISSAEKAWGELDFGAHRKMPELNTVMTQTINSLGGWRYLGQSRNQMADRSNFYKNYNKFLSEYIGETL